MEIPEHEKEASNKENMLYDIVNADILENFETVQPKKNRKRSSILKRTSQEVAGGKDERRESRKRKVSFASTFQVLEYQREAKLIVTENDSGSENQPQKLLTPEELLVPVPIPEKVSVTELKSSITRINQSTDTLSLGSILKESSEDSKNTSQFLKNILNTEKLNVDIIDKQILEPSAKKKKKPNLFPDSDSNKNSISVLSRQSLKEKTLENTLRNKFCLQTGEILVGSATENLTLVLPVVESQSPTCEENDGDRVTHIDRKGDLIVEGCMGDEIFNVSFLKTFDDDEENNDAVGKNLPDQPGKPPFKPESEKQLTSSTSCYGIHGAKPSFNVTVRDDVNMSVSVLAEDSVNKTESDSLFGEKHLGKSQTSKTVLYDDPMDFTCKLFPSEKLSLKKKCSSFPTSEISQSKTLLVNDPMDFTCKVSSSEQDKSFNPQNTCSLFPKSKVNQNKTLLVNDTMDITCKLHITGKDSQSENPESLDEDTVKTGLSNLKVLEKFPEEDDGECPDILTALLMQENRSHCETGKSFLLDDTMDFTCKFSSTRINRISQSKISPDIDSSIVSCNAPDESDMKDNNYDVPEKQSLNNNDNNLALSNGLLRKNIVSDVNLTSSVMHKNESQTQMGKTLLFNATMDFTCKLPSSKSQRNYCVEESTVVTAETDIDSNILRCNVPDESDNKDRNYIMLKKLSLNNKDDNLAVSSGVLRENVKPDDVNSSVTQESKGRIQGGKTLLFNNTMDFTCKLPSSRSQRNSLIKDSNQSTVEITKPDIVTSIRNCGVPDESSSQNKNSVTLKKHPLTDNDDNLMLSSGVLRKNIEPDVTVNSSVMQKEKNQVQVSKTLLFNDSMDFTCKFPSFKCQRSSHVKDLNQSAVEMTKSGIDTSILNFDIPDKSGSQCKNLVMLKKHSLNDSNNLAVSSEVSRKNIEPDVSLTSSVMQKGKDQIQVDKTQLSNDSVDFRHKLPSSSSQRNSHVKDCNVLTVEMTETDENVSTLTFKIPEREDANDDTQYLALKKDEYCSKDNRDDGLLTKLAISENITANNTSVIAPLPKDEKSVIISKTSLSSDSMDFACEVLSAKKAEILHIKGLKNAVNEAKEKFVNDVSEVSFNSRTPKELHNRENIVALNSILTKPDMQVRHIVSDRNMASVAEMMSEINTNMEIPVPENNEFTSASRTLLYNDSMDFTCKFPLSKSNKSACIQSLENYGEKTDVNVHTLCSKTLENLNIERSDGVTSLLSEKCIMDEPGLVDRESSPMLKSDIPGEIVEYADTIAFLPKKERPVLVGKALLFNDSMDFTCKIPSVENARTLLVENSELINNDSVEMDRNISSFAAADGPELLDFNRTNEANIDTATKNEAIERSVEYVGIPNSKNPVPFSKTLMLDDSMDFTCKAPFVVSAKKSDIDRIESTNKSVIETECDTYFLSSKKGKSIDVENNNLSGFASEKRVDEVLSVNNSVSVKKDMLLGSPMKYDDVITSLSKNESGTVTSKTLLKNDSMDFTCKISTAKGKENKVIEDYAPTSNIKTNPDVIMESKKEIFIHNTSIISQVNKSPIKETDVMRTSGSVLLKNSGKALHISAAVKRQSPVMLDEQCSPPKILELDSIAKRNSLSKTETSEAVNFVLPDSDKTALSPVDMDVSCINRLPNNAELEVFNSDFGGNYQDLNADKPTLVSECCVSDQGFSDNYQTKLSENSLEVFKTNKIIPLYSVNGSPLCGKMISTKEDQILPIRSCDRTQLNTIDMEITYSANDALNSSKLDFKSKEVSFYESDMQETRCASNPHFHDKAMKEIEQSVKFSFAGMELTCNQLTRFQFEFSKSASQMPNIDSFGIEVSPSSEVEEEEENVCYNSRQSPQMAVAENSPILKKTDLDRTILSSVSEDSMLSSPSALSLSSPADANSVPESCANALECINTQTHIESSKNVSPIVPEKSMISMPQNISTTPISHYSCITFPASDSSEKTNVNEIESHSCDLRVETHKISVEHKNIVTDANLQTALSEKPISDLGVGITDQNASIYSLAEAEVCENHLAFSPSNSKTDKHLKNSVSAYNALQSVPDFQEYSDFKTPDLNQWKASKCAASIRDACLTEQSSSRKAKVINLKEMLGNKTHVETNKKFCLDSEEISRLPALVSNVESISSNSLQPPKSKPVDTFTPLVSTSLHNSNKQTEGSVNKCARNIPQIDVLFKLKESKKIASMIPGTCSQVNEMSSDLAYNSVKGLDIPKWSLPNIVEVSHSASSLGKDDVQAEMPVDINEHFEHHNQVSQSDIKMSSEQKVEHISAHCTDDQMKKGVNSVTEHLLKYGTSSTLSNSLCFNNTVNLPFDKKQTSRTFYASLDMSVKENDVEYARSPFRKSFKINDEACDSLRILSDSVLQNGTFEVDSVFLEKSLRQKNVTNDVSSTAPHFSESDVNVEKDLVHEVSIAEAHPSIGPYIQSISSETAVAKENSDSEALTLNSTNISNEKESMKNQAYNITGSNITTCHGNKCFSSASLETTAAEEKFPGECTFKKLSPPEDVIESFVLCSSNMLGERSPKNEVFNTADSSIPMCHEKTSSASVSLETVTADKISVDEDAFRKPSPLESPDVNSFVLCSSSTSNERLQQKKTCNTANSNIPAYHESTFTTSSSLGTTATKEKSADETAFKKSPLPEEDIENIIVCSTTTVNESSLNEKFNVSGSNISTYHNNTSSATGSFEITAAKEKSVDGDAFKEQSPPENPDIEAFVLNSSNVLCEKELLKDKSFNTAVPNTTTYVKNTSSVSLETPVAMEKSADGCAFESTPPKNPLEVDSEHFVLCTSDTSNERSSKHEAFSTAGFNSSKNLENASFTSAPLKTAVAIGKSTKDCALKMPFSPENLNAETSLLNSPNILNAVESPRYEILKTAGSNIPTCHKSFSTASVPLETTAVTVKAADQFACEKLAPLENSDNFSFILCSPNNMNEKSPKNQACNIVHSNFTTLQQNTASILDSSETVVAKEKCSDERSFKKSSLSEDSDIYSFIICSPNDTSEKSPKNEVCNVNNSKVAAFDKTVASPLGKFKLEICDYKRTVKDGSSLHNADNKDNYEMHGLNYSEQLVRLNSSKHSDFQSSTENTAGITDSCTNSDITKLSTAYVNGKHTVNCEYNDDADEINQLHKGTGGSSFQDIEICDSAISKNKAETSFINEGIPLDSPKTSGTKTLINASMLQEYMMPMEVPASPVKMLMCLIPDDYETKACKNRKSALSCGRRRSKSFGGPTTGADLHNLIPVDLPTDVRLKQFFRLAFQHTLTSVCRELREEQEFDANLVMDTLSEHYDTIEHVIEEKNLFALATTKPPEVKQPEDIASEKFVEAISVLEKESDNWDRMLDLEKEKLDQCDTNLDVNPHDVDSELENLINYDCSEILADTNRMKINLIQRTEKMLETVTNIPVLISEINKTLINDSETVVSEYLSKDTFETPRTLLRNIRLRR